MPSNMLHDENNPKHALLRHMCVIASEGLSPMISLFVIILPQMKEKTLVMKRRSVFAPLK